MKNNIFDKIFISLFLIFISFFTLSGIIIKDKETSETERRKLEQLPELNKKDILDKSYMEDLDKYFLDQFPFRDDMRSLKANFNYNILRQLDNNDITVKDKYIFKNEFPTNKESIDNFIEKTNNIIAKLPNKNIYLGIIPDKNYYIDDKLFLNIDYDYLYNKVKDETDTNFMDFRPTLKLSSYYRTDTHWQQNKLKSVVNLLNKEMNLNNKWNYKMRKVRDFYGVYYGQSALNIIPDTITYMTNDTILDAKVEYYGSDEIEIYINHKKSFDKYDIFLSGAEPFIKIKNFRAKEDRELVIFRDSFASSLTPLLLESYSKITLIDTRYIDSKNYKKLIEFKDQDILFLYSTLIVNNSFTLKN